MYYFVKSQELNISGSNIDTVFHEPEKSVDGFMSYHDDMKQLCAEGSILRVRESNIIYFLITEEYKEWISRMKVDEVLEVDEIPEIFKSLDS